MANTRDLGVLAGGRPTACVAMSVAWSKLAFEKHYPEKRNHGMVCML